MSITKALRNFGHITFMAMSFIVVGVLVSFSSHAQTGVIAKAANNDAPVFRHGCFDEFALEEFYKADVRNDKAQQNALVLDELCFYIVGMKYSLIEKLGNYSSKISGGISYVRIYTAGNSKLADYGASIELYAPNKYLRDTKAEKSKRYSDYTVVDGLIPYKVWSRKTQGTAKVSFEVAVPIIDDRLPTEQEIGAISKHLVKSERVKYKRAFVAFLLPEMERGAGALATAHHNPKMVVQMMPFMLHLYPQYKKFAE